MKKYTRNEWGRCENYTRNEWGKCKNYKSLGCQVQAHYRGHHDRKTQDQRFPRSSGENYTRNEWGRCENYTRNEWGKCQNYKRVGKM